MFIPNIKDVKKMLILKGKRTVRTYTLTFKISIIFIHCSP